MKNLPLDLLCFLPLIYTLWLTYRNSQVTAFRVRLIEKEGLLKRKILYKTGEYDNDRKWIIDVMPKHEKMLFSMRPLKEENWLIVEQVIELNENYNP